MSSRLLTWRTLPVTCCTCQCFMCALSSLCTCDTHFIQRKAESSLLTCHPLPHVLTAWFQLLADIMRAVSVATVKKDQLRGSLAFQHASLSYNGTRLARGSLRGFSGLKCVVAMAGVPKSRGLQHHPSAGFLFVNLKQTHCQGGF